MKKVDKAKRLIFIMSMHIIVVWSLSVWSYSGTTSGNAVRGFFRFASSTIPAPTEYNYLAIMIAPLLFFGGTFGVRKALNRIFEEA